MIKPSLSSYLFALRFTVKQRYMLFFAFGLCIIFLWHILLSVPLDKKIDKLQKKLDAMIILKNESQKKTVSSSIAYNTCDTIANFLKLIGEHKITLESLEQQEEINKQLKICIRFSSSFDSLDLFFKDFSHRFSYTKIENVELSTSKKNLSLISCLLVYSLYGDTCEIQQ